jgi:hypothetical protein
VSKIGGVFCMARGRPEAATVGVNRTRHKLPSAPEPRFKPRRWRDNFSRTGALRPVDPVRAADDRLGRWLESLVR